MRYAYDFVKVNSKLQSNLEEVLFPVRAARDIIKPDGAQNKRTTFSTKTRICIKLEKFNLRNLFWLKCSPIWKKNNCWATQECSHHFRFLLLFFSWSRKSRFASLVTYRSCDLSIVLHMTYEGSASVVLFLDVRNAVSSHFWLCVLCRFHCRFSQPR